MSIRGLILVTVLLVSPMFISSVRADGFDMQSQDLVSDSSQESENKGPTTSKIPEIPEVKVAGRDVQILLSQFFPNLDEYLQELIAQTESLTVERRNGYMRVEIVFDLDGDDDVIRFKAKERTEAKYGEIYQVTFDKTVRLSISMNGDEIRLGAIEGVNAWVKLPVISDRVNFYRMVLQTVRNELAVYVRAVGGWARFVGHANVLKREVYGLDWIATILANMQFLSF